MLLWSSRTELEKKTSKPNPCKIPPYVKSTKYSGKYLYIHAHSSSDHMAKRWKQPKTPLMAKEIN